ncbi:DUF1824 family protein [Synechococcus sp. CS-1325]|uniref:DUF1824 family protein n=1 Tax=unclassified Synechococcus TaxID=2626047 RepID=UPI000DB5B090|nr:MULTISPECIES: DUF1824 family protein [unclassified Synechococcus]MCT0199501.1 DUF1824 family protein [Synechococcus sp. CS-1325]MCT0229847.1 DUF1824 family protein [Synechococcus sp. CS-1324]PZV02547.1 MAG: DUF1824 domain-containing protein [Cyanobium sp.]PZV06095.1 MAG: DUF1824 domain-containing protein [Cyanobium sp.]
MNPPTDLPELASLADLCGLRTAPSIDDRQQERILRELLATVAGCEWFTVGVMAPSGAAAVAALRSCERALGWQALVAEADALPAAAGPVFLKGNQSTGLFRLRPETGLGHGLLITGHHGSDPDAEGTWGPFPLDFFG